MTCRICRGICKKRNYVPNSYHWVRNGKTYCVVCHSQIPVEDLIDGKRCPCCSNTVRWRKRTR